MYVYAWIQWCLSYVDPVTITDPSTNIRVMEDEGGVVIFTCTARGVPVSSIMWIPASGVRMQIDSSPEVTDDDGFIFVTSTLTISNLTRDDAGHYTCIASNVMVGPDMPEIRVFTLEIENCECLVN